MNIFLERIFKTEYVLERTKDNNYGIYCFYVPSSLVEMKIKEYDYIQNELSTKISLKISEIDDFETFTDEELADYDKLFIKTS